LLKKKSYIKFQGFYFYKPMVFEELEKYLHKIDKK